MDNEPTRRNAGVPAGPFVPPIRRAGGDAGAPSRAGGDAGAPRGAPRGWYSRGYLPHRDVAGLQQAITFRLADSLPQEKLRGLEAELERLPEGERSAERRRRIERWLDAGMGCCALRHPAVAAQVRASLGHFDGERYRLLAWCVMPNHVHALIEPLGPLATIVQGWKSVTARWALARNGELNLGIPDPRHLWMREYWDRYIRDAHHRRRVVDYIHRNPVKAGLCAEPAAWPWSSAARSAGVPAGSADGGEERADGDVGVPGWKGPAGTAGPA